MPGADRQGGLYRQEALDNYARLDRHDAPPAFDPAKAMPRWGALLAGAASLAALAAGGLTYQVTQGPKGVLVDVADDSVVVAFSDTPPELVGEPVVLALPDGTEIEGTATQSEVMNGNGVTGTMLLIELDAAGAAAGRDGQAVTVDTGRTPLLTDVFSRRGEG